MRKRKSHDEYWIGGNARRTFKPFCFVEWDIEISFSVSGIWVSTVGDYGYRKSAGNYY